MRKLEWRIKVEGKTLNYPILDYQIDKNRETMNLYYNEIDYRSRKGR